MSEINPHELEQHLQTLRARIDQRRRTLADYLEGGAAGDLDGRIFDEGAERVWEALGGLSAYNQFGDLLRDTSRALEQETISLRDLLAAIAHDVDLISELMLVLDWVQQEINTISDFQKRAQVMSSVQRLRDAARDWQHNLGPIEEARSTLDRAYADIRTKRDEATLEVLEARVAQFEHRVDSTKMTLPAVTQAVLVNEADLWRRRAHQLRVLYSAVQPHELPSKKTPAVRQLYLAHLDRLWSTVQNVAPDVFAVYEPLWQREFSQTWKAYTSLFQVPFSLGERYANAARQHAHSVASVGLDLLDKTGDLGLPPLSTMLEPDTRGQGSLWLKLLPVGLLALAGTVIAVLALLGGRNAADDAGRIQQTLDVVAPQATQALAQVDELNDQLVQEQTALAALDPQIEDAAGQIATLLPQMDVLGTEVAMEKATLTMLAPQVASSAEDLTELSLNLDSVQETVVALENSVVEMSEQLLTPTPTPAAPPKPSARFLLDDGTEIDALNIRPGDTGFESPSVVLEYSDLSPDTSLAVKWSGDGPDLLVSVLDSGNTLITWTGEPFVLPLNGGSGQLLLKIRVVVPRETSPTGKVFLTVTVEGERLASLLLDIGETVTSEDLSFIAPIVFNGDKDEMSNVARTIVPDWLCIDPADISDAAEPIPARIYVWDTPETNADGPPLWDEWQVSENARVLWPCRGDETSTLFVPAPASLREMLDDSGEVITPQPIGMLALDGQTGWLVRLDVFVRSKP